MNVYHSGEIEVQKKSNAEVVAEQNGRTIKQSMSKGVIRFLESQYLLVIANVDQDGRVWCSFLIGSPGFIQAHDEEHLKIECPYIEGDPVLTGFQPDSEIGILAIDFIRRARVRINGQANFDKEQLIVTTEQVYGNCPKYIQRRELVSDQNRGRLHRAPASSVSTSRLNAEQQDWIRGADTFFIGSVSQAGKADASHRGGNPGFIRIVHDRRLMFPDYFGNSMFNTLGNIHTNPNSGLLFIDFQGGHSLHLTGRSTIQWEESLIRQFPGAEKVVQFDIDEVLYIENSTCLTWGLTEYSPANPELGRSKGGDA